MSNRPIKAQGFSEDACFSVINISLHIEALDGAVTLLDERGSSWMASSLFSPRFRFNIYRHPSLSWLQLLAPFLGQWTVVP